MPLGGVIMNANDMTGFEEMAMTTLLGHRFGDRLVYLQGPNDRRLLKQAGRLGLVDEAGYLTSSGYQFWQRQGYRSIFSVDQARCAAKARAATTPGRQPRP